MRNEINQGSKGHLQCRLYTLEELEKNGKTAHAHVRSTNAIVKMITLLKAIHIIHSIPIQIYFSFSQTWKKNPKIHMKKTHNTIESENIHS